MKNRLTSHLTRTGIGLCMVIAIGCGSDQITTASSGTTKGTDLTAGYRQASWGQNVTVTYANGTLRYVSNGIPNHARDAEYAVGNAQTMIPDSSTAVAVADFTAAQNYDFSIPVTPVKAATPTATNLGVIGVMISGAALFNPFEGDGRTVATQSNFSVPGSNGNRAWFLDSCNGHPTPMGGTYHYHALPACVTAVVDSANGPSHLIGIAFDGFPIYGDRDIQGQPVAPSALDACNGLTSPTPEFPEGVYHYVLLNVAGPTSSIQCFTGTVDSSLTNMGGMGGGMPPPPPPRGVMQM